VIAADSTRLASAAFSPSSQIRAGLDLMCERLLMRRLSERVERAVALRAGMIDERHGAA
jgi:hypothetical protein